MPAGGTGVAPTGGNPQGGAAGASAGSTSSGAAGASGGAAPDLKTTVGGPLDGAMLLGPCLTDSSTNVCQTKPQNEACPPANEDDPALSGKITTDTTLTLGGDATKTYTITLHVQGEVEAKAYNNGIDQSSLGSSPKLDGFYVGGRPGSGDAYNVYMLRVDNPKQDYFFN